MLRLDHNRALTQLAQKAGVAVSDIEDMTVWGNHSPTMYADYRFAKVNGESLKDKINDVVPDATSLAQGPAMSTIASKAVEDAIAGLITLGFKPEPARKTINQIIQNLPETEYKADLLIRQALMVLNT